MYHYCTDALARTPKSCVSVHKSFLVHVRAMHVAAGTRSLVKSITCQVGLQMHTCHRKNIRITCAVACTRWHDTAGVMQHLATNVSSNKSRCR